jgi:hypothetical protein
MEQQLRQELKEYIQQRADIPEHMLDEWLSVYTLDTKIVDLIFDLDHVSQWLGIKKSQIVKTLKTSYMEELYYTIEKTTKRNTDQKYGGNNYKKVLISPDCFKELCMRSKLRTSQDVVLHFFKFEDLVYEYKLSRLP